MRSLTGKTALVTGAARGIGRAIALRLASEGMRVTLADQDTSRLSQTLREVARHSPQTDAVSCDLGDPVQLERLAQQTLDRGAGVDLLVNNAGVAHYGRVDHMPARCVDELLAVNLRAPIELTRLLLPSLLARPEAHVLNVSSVLGLTPMPKTTVYCATKHALIGFGDSLRREFGRQGLGVTTLCPGFVRTPLLEEAQSVAGPRPRRPPALLCVPVERVARAAVRGVRRNRRRVVVDPLGRFVRIAMNGAPWLFDTLYALGQSKRVNRKRAELDAISLDREMALRQRLGLGEQPATRKRAA